jgi:hypothetical protein
MQTLNVGAGRTDEEYKAAEEQRRADLKADSESNANFFFVAAVLAAVGTGLCLVRLNFAVTIGAIDLLALYGGPNVRLHPFLVYEAAIAWVALLVALGFAAKSGHRWAFLAGVVLYGADMIALALMFSWLSIGIHGFFVFKWFEGQRELRDLKEATSGTV